MEASDQLCRLCLKETSEYAGLFDFQNGIRVADLVTQFCPITIRKNEDEKFPKHVCLECLELIVDAIHLRDLSLINDQELRQNVKQENEIVEIEEEYIEEEELEDAGMAEDEVPTEFLTVEMVSVMKPMPKIIPPTIENFCVICSLSFFSRSSLKRHQLRKHSNLQFTCDMCNTSHKSKLDMEKHMSKLHSVPGVTFLYSDKILMDLTDMCEKLDVPEPLTCSFCAFSDHSEVILYEHLLTHQDVVDSGKMVCTICPTSINSMSFMIEHTKSHNEKLKTHRCLVCNKIFSFDDKFVNHLRNHKKNQHKICFCPECGRKFSKPSLLNDHIRFIHNKESLHCCPQCGQGFGSKSALNGHLKRHNEPNKFPCPYCPKSFANHNTLNSHKVVHTSERHFACTLCDKRFKNQKVLGDHMKRHEQSRPLFICSVCDKALNTQYSLSRHMLIHLGTKPFSCEYCHKAYAQKNDLNKHLRTHVGENTYFCEYPECNESFRILGDLRIHDAVHYLKT